ncbi:MAG: hypothetical protein WBL93_00410 [Lutisporaceae bacterium]
MYLLKHGRAFMIPSICSRRNFLFGQSAIRIPNVKLKMQYVEGLYKLTVKNEA